MANDEKKIYNKCEVVLMIRTKDELLESLRTRVGEDTDDETLSLIEDITDTVSDLESRASDTTNWKNKYEENDKEWRQKYRDRFFEGSGTTEEPDYAEDDEPKKLRFEDLFSIKEV